MSQTYTITETWSQTHARYVAGKVAADLRQIRQAYGQPTEGLIENYLAELTVLLADGYVGEVSYGYRRDGAWVLALKYTADMYGNLSTDDRSGSIPRGVDISGASWFSFMSYTDKWYKLSHHERDAIKRQLPFDRTAGAEPVIRIGDWLRDKTYSSAGCGLRRASIGGA